MFDYTIEVSCAFEDLLFLLDTEAIVIEGESRTDIIRNAALVTVGNEYFLISADMELPNRTTRISGVSLKSVLSFVSELDLQEVENV